MNRVLRGSVIFAVLGCAALLVSAAAAPAEELRLTQGSSTVLDFTGDIRQISTSDPAIVDAVAVSTREVLLHARGAGIATVVVWSQTGDRRLYTVVVEQNLDELRRLLRDTFPGEDIQVRSSRDAVSLTGRVSNKEISDRVTALVTPFGKSIVNNVAIAPPPADKQIVLRVRFAELNRRAAKQFGVNLISTGAGNTIGGTTTGQFSPPRTSEVSGGIPGRLQGATANFTLSDALNIFAFRPDLNLAGFVRALQGQNLLQILAEPNLVTTSGREASFLVGGEFPVPVLQGGGNAGAVTVQFREFGIRLSFTPNLVADDRIRLHVRPEVSTIDVNNAVTVAGFLIPALGTRRVETNIELTVGQSFAIAGLIDNRVQETVNRVPGLASIPLLGALFKSFDRSKNESELVVIVTPEIVSPLKPGEPHPLPPFPEEFLGPAKPADSKPAPDNSEPATRSSAAENPRKSGRAFPFLRKKKG